MEAQRAHLARRAVSVVRRRDAGYRVGGAGDNRRVRRGVQRGVQRARDRAGLGAGQRPVACGVARAPHTGRTRAYAPVTGPTLTRTAGGRLAGVCGSTGATWRNLPHGAGVRHGLRAAIDAVAGVRTPRAPATDDRGLV